MEITKKENPLIRSICIDTLTGIQTDVYMAETMKTSHDTWLDYGKSIWELIAYLKKHKFHTIMILGEPGTGKTVGMRNLEHNTNVWVNADKKEPNWAGGKIEYGKTVAPRLPYHFIPNSYKSIEHHIDELFKRGQIEEERFAILTGHVEDYKSGNQMKKRLKTLGKVASKMQLEGTLNEVFYSNIVIENGSPKYVLETQNDGTNTARSSMGLFEPIIENDYNFIIEKLKGF